jgi:hypothetical protein
MRDTNNEALLCCCCTRSKTLCADCSLSLWFESNSSLCCIDFPSISLLLSLLLGGWTRTKGATVIISAKQIEVVHNAKSPQSRFHRFCSIVHKFYILRPFHSSYRCSTCWQLIRRGGCVRTTFEIEFLENCMLLLHRRYLSLILHNHGPTTKPQRRTRPLFRIEQRSKSIEYGS